VAPVRGRYSEAEDADSAPYTGAPFDHVEVNLRNALLAEDEFGHRQQCELRALAEESGPFRRIGFLRVATQHHILRSHFATARGSKRTHVPTRNEGIRPDLASLKTVMRETASSSAHSAALTTHRQNLMQLPTRNDGMISASRI
jgi:hypothetical protein